ncbi:hypothetical protein OIV83_000246 [Microbotryomycetes sp. JL201]|nr:hypothetical protein OIV83_000246 [Microbotryomycetes sp. JL201]
MSQLPPELKALSPYLARAKELATVEPVISYWCTYYALQQAIEIESKDADSNAYLLSLMDKLEQASLALPWMKEQLKDKDTVTDDAAASAYVENFAIKVFAQADNEDRAGKSSRMTAKKFLAAANFLEILGVFGDMSGEISEKIKYSKWKASDISKSLREGKKPTPGPAGGLPDTELSASVADVTKDEAKELAKELAELGTEEERAKATMGDGAPAQNTRSAKASGTESASSASSSYSFPQVPASAPLPSPGPIPEEYDNSLQSTMPVSFDSTHVSDNSQSSFAPDRDDTSTPVPPTTHQTAELAPPPPHEPNSSGFASAVFPSAPSSIPKPTAPPAAPSNPVAANIPSPSPVPNVLSERAAPSTPLPTATATAAALPDTLDPMVVSNIQKHAKWAISALNYDDYETARKELRLALSMLGG